MSKMSLATAQNGTNTNYTLLLSQFVMGILLIVGICYYVPILSKVNVSYGDPKSVAVERMVDAPPGEGRKKKGARKPVAEKAAILDFSAPAQKASSEDIRAYIKANAAIAVAEMRKFGIPASITMAQAILESDAGQSKLARETNNHFGIKCPPGTKCAKGHCKNFTDDTHKDFFRCYPSAWQSYRDHSVFLKSAARYDGLFRLAPTDCTGWARGLKKAGYATDKRYAEKLIAIIDGFDLSRLDLIP